MPKTVHTLHQKMLLRLSRLAFWLAAASAAVGLIAPHGHETLWTAITVAGSTFAFLFWRSGVRAEGRAACLEPFSEPTPLDQVALADASASLERTVAAAASFEAALHAVARLLRGELGARDTAVYWLKAQGSNHAQVSTLIESQPGFRTVARNLRLDALPLGVAIASRQEAGELPGNLAVPAVVGERVVAVIELIGVDIAFEPQALASVLRSARCALSHCAAVEQDVPNVASDTQFVIDGERNREPRVDDHLSSQPGPASGTHGMLSMPGDGVSEAPVLDPAALARLTELDPSGTNRLIERVLQAFQTSVARLRPQAETARLNGDRAALRLVAHTLKSSSASIGALRLSQLCAQIETIIRQDTQENLEPYHAALSSALDEALGAIDVLLKAQT
jgi:HPt (histidine-containing phosphotransfer) domain-containing protein